MKKLSIIILFYLIVNKTYSQTNLVQNPSFETYTTCPSTLDQLNYSTGWSSYGGSPDYFNLCNGGGLSVPKNGIGYQSPFSGNAYAGFIAYDIGGFYREIIGSQLSQTLSIGQKYFVSLKINLAEFQPPPPQFIPCNKVGVRFSTVPFSKTNPAPINNFAHIYTTSIISDTMNWSTIKSFFIADSNYKYIMVGNFFDDANTNIIPQSNGVKSYFFLDDICISTDSNTCYSPTNIEPYENIDFINIYPNPSSSFISIENKLYNESILIIKSCTGEEMIRKSFEKDIRLDLLSFPNGVYFVEVQSNKKRMLKKIIINH